MTGTDLDDQKQSVSWETNHERLRKKIFVVIWLLGVLLIFTFRTPVKYYRFYDRYVVMYTHVFSKHGKILAGQLVLYLTIWSATIFFTYLVIQSLKRKA